MKLLRIFPLALLALTLLSACGAAKYYQGFTSGDASTGIALLNPVSCIYYLDSKGAETLDDSLSLVSEAMVAGIVGQQELPITQTLPLDSLQREEYIAFMRFASARTDVVREEAPIPYVLDSLLEANGQRYGLLVYTEGMTRDTRQYAKELALSATFGLLLAVATLGTFTMYGAGMAYATVMNVAIVDSDYDRIVFHNGIPVRESNPLDEGHIQKILTGLFREYNKKK